VGGRKWGVSVRGRGGVCILLRWVGREDGGGGKGRVEIVEE